MKSNNKRTGTSPESMTDKTISEELFETFCADHGVECRPIPRAAMRTPDYELDVASHRAIAEVKQIDPNEDDEQAQREVDESGRVNLAGKAGKRMRQVITNSKDQIGRLARGVCPGLLVVYNNAGVSVHHTDPMFVLTAMYGHVAARIRLPAQPGEEPVLEEMLFGGERRVTEEHSTSISAVCVLYRSPAGPPGLSFYHNAFAAQPFDPNWLRGEWIHHFVIKDAKSHKFENWTEV